MRSDGLTGSVYTRPRRLATPAGGLLGTSPRTLLDPKGSASSATKTRPPLRTAHRVEGRDRWTSNPPCIGVRALVPGWRGFSIVGAALGDVSSSESSRRGRGASCSLTDGIWGLRARSTAGHLLGGMRCPIRCSIHRRAGDGAFMRSMTTGISTLPSNRLVRMMGGAVRSSSVARYCA